MARRPKKTTAKGPPEREPPKDWQWWVLAAAVPLMICVSKLSLDLWSDEAYTLAFFVSKPWFQIAGDYSAPNNHVFYSLLLRPFYLISDSNFVLRLPSLAFTVGTLVMVFRVSRRWAGLPAAVLATLTLGLTQMFLGHTMQVRGYGLSMFLAAWLGDLVLGGKTPEISSGEGRNETQDMARPSLGYLAAVVFVGAAFLYVMPSNVLFLVPLGIAAVSWTAFRRRSWPAAAWVAAPWLAACVLAGLLYLPILDQVLAARGDPVDRPFLGAVGLGRQVFYAATRDWLPILPLATLGMVVGFRKLRQERSAEGLGLPLVATAVLFLPFLLAGILGVLPFARSFCPILPFLAIAVGWSLAELLSAIVRLLPRKGNEPTMALLGMVVLAVAAGPKLWTYEARLTEYRRTHFAQDGYFNYYAANFHPAQVVAALHDLIPEKQGYLICFSDADHFALTRYFSHYGLPLQRHKEGSPPLIFTITPELADYEALATKFDLPADALQRLPLVHDFGYYRLHGSTVDDRPMIEGPSTNR